MSSFVRDLRNAWRSLKKTPGPSALLVREVDRT
jgi:hypothetical protein